MKTRALMFWSRLLVTCAVGLCVGSARGVSVAPEDLTEAHQWAAARFDGVAGSRAIEPALLVIANHDAVQKNSRSGKPLRIVDRSYTHGLYCHAYSKIIVRLPGPCASFSAIAGIDSNEQTSGGRGSVDFSVHVGTVEKFRSGVMREGMAGKAVNVDLGGASEFTLLADPTPDGISCDQADWANAMVALQDGREMWLADLPLRDGEPEPFSTNAPFSFVYNGKASEDLLPAWKLERSSRPLDAQRRERTLLWTDGDTGLQARCVAVEYADFPTVEWTLYFTNTGTADTPILENLQPLDLTLHRGNSGEFLLHHNKGTFVRADDFEPLLTTLAPRQELRFAPPGGRPLGQVFPYFNIEEPAGAGVIAVVGWPGQWFADFLRDDGGSLRIRAGQEQTHLKLHPGEGVRTPLVALQFWRGQWIDSQNVWRRWMLAHNVPRRGGEPLGPEMAACSSHQFGEMINANEQNQILFIDRYLEEKLPLDYWWMDAGWYSNYDSGWPRTGAWEVDTARFPNGLRAITDHAHARGVKSIVWFEPERVAAGTWLYTNNPAWLLGRDGNQKLLNLGLPEARQWAIDHYWRGADAPDRKGVTENHYVAGYLAYWDALRARFPNLVIDTCASGGHRNDLETLRRAVPLLRSDYILEPIGQQCHTCGLALWMPFYGTGTGAMDAYNFRSQMSPHFTACFDMRRRDLPFAEARRLVNQWKFEIAPDYFGDFYPLSPCTTADDVWMAWQFDRPEAGQGVVQAFRRANSFYESARFKLHGLKADARYRVKNLDIAGEEEFSGRELMEKGILVTATSQPAAEVLTYKVK
jgi:alpha-galactosidase